MNSADELDRVWEQTWGLLRRSLDDTTAPARTPVLATRGRAWGVNARTVVLRALDEVNRTLYINTDRRSQKHAELRADPRAALVFYDPPTGVQARFDVSVRLVGEESIRRRAWEALSEEGRRNYALPGAPGTPLIREHAAACEAERGFANFVVLAAAAHRLDWLMVRSDPHRRALFHWSGTDRPQAEWVFP